MKKIKSLIYLLVFILAGPTSHAQEFDISWGQEMPLKKKAMGANIIGTLNKKVYVLNSDNPKNVSSYIINVFNQDNLEKEQSIIFKDLFPEEIAKSDLEKIVLLQDKIVVLTSTKKDELHGSLIDLDGKIIKAKVQLDKLEKKDGDFEGYTIALSDDRSQLLVMRKIEVKKKENLRYSFLLYNSDLKKTASNKPTLPYDREHFTFTRALVDNSGDVYFTGRVKTDGKRKKFDTFKSVVMSLSLGAKDIEFNEINLPFEKRIAASLTMYISGDKLNLTGLYASNKEAELLEGVFHIELNKKSYDIISSSYSPFKKGLLSRTVAAKKMEPGVNFSYDLKNIFEKPDGGRYLVLESNSIYFESSKNGSSKNVVMTDIIVLNLNKQNEIEWNTLIPKNQWIRIPYSQTIGMGMLTYTVSIYRFYKKYEDLLGYVCILKGNELHFIFNDHNKNMGAKTADETFNNFKKSYCAAVTLNLENGKWVKKALFKNKEAQLLLTPGNSEQVTDSEVITFSFNKDAKSSIGKIRLD